MSMINKEVSPIFIVIAFFNDYIIDIANANYFMQQCTTIAKKNLSSETTHDKKLAEFFEMLADPLITF